MKILINCVTNNSYFHYLESFLYSLSNSNLKYKVRVELVNVPKYKITWLNSLEFIEETIVTKYKFSDSNQEKGYCTNRRVNLLKTSFVYNEFDYVSYFDVNTLIVGNLYTFLSENLNYQLFLYYNTDHDSLRKKVLCKSLSLQGPLGTPYYGVMKAGVQIYKNEEFSVKFIDQYDKIVGTNNVDWYADQEGLFLTVQKFPKKRLYNFYKTNKVSFNEVDKNTLILYNKGRGSPHFNNMIKEIYYGNCIHKISLIKLQEPVNLNHNSSLFFNILRRICRLIHF